MKFYENLLVELALMASPLAAIPVSAVSWSYPTDPIQRLPFDSGEGTINAPYVITNAQQLADLSWYVNTGRTYEGAYFVLGNDIELNPGFTFEKDGTYKGEGSPKQWVPIGSGEKSVFKAHFDGCNHKITGVYQDSLVVVKDTYPSEGMHSYMGLFGYVANDTLCNITIANSLIKLNCNIEGIENVNIRVGALAGSANNSVVYNCVNEANVGIYSDSRSGCGNSFLGGLVGDMYISYEKSVNISDCHNSGAISTDLKETSTGGLFGNINGDFKMSNCSNNGDISGTWLTAGLVGETWTNVAKNTGLENLQNSGNILGNGSVAGILASCSGYIIHATNCVNKGNVTSTADNSYSGGLFGQFIGGDIINCHNEGEVYGGSGIVEYTYSPRIIDTYNTGKITGGSGLTGDCPYLVEAKRLFNTGDVFVQKDKDGNFKYNHLSQVGLINAVSGLGQDSLSFEDCYNEGRVEGISGLFGSLNVKNVKVKNCHNTGDVTTIGYDNNSVYSVSGIVLYAQSSNIVIDSCYNKGNISGMENASGIIESGSLTKIHNSYNKGNISGCVSAAGITTGAVYEIQNSYNEGDVYSDDIAIGLVSYIGYSENGVRLINNVYNAGNVSSTNAVAGITNDVGYLPGQKAVFSNLFNYGKLTKGSATDELVNPIVKKMYYPYEDLVFSNCFNLSQPGVEISKEVGLNVTEEEFASGKICVLLNKGQETAPWGQTLGVDAYPRLNGKGNPDVSGIVNIVEDTKVKKSGVFDLSGRKITGSKLGKGIYIVNGKKMVF